MKKYYTFCLLISTTAASYSQPGAPEPAFNGTGYTFTGVPGKINTAFEAGIAQPDGKIIAVGSADEFANNPYNTDAVVARYNPDGTPDAPFGSSGIVVTDIEQMNNSFYAVGLQQDAKIVAAGRAQTTGDSRADGVVARYNSDGSLDPSFGNGGQVRLSFSFYDDQIEAIAIQPDGRIILVGTYYNGSADMLVARLNADGSLDATFGNHGKTLVDFLSGNDLGTGVTLQPDGKILAAAYTYGPAGSDMGVTRLNTDGSPDATFGNDGKVTADIYGSPDDAAQAVVLQGSRIIVGGWSLLPVTAPQKYYMALAAFNADGTPDLSFGDNGIDTTDFGISHDFFYGIVSRGNQIIGAGAASQDAMQTNNENYDFALVAYDPDGAQDPAFGENGKVSSDFSGGSGLVSGDLGRGIFYHNNTLYVVGHAAQFTGEWDYTSYGVIAAYQLEPLTTCFVSAISGLTATPSSLWPPNQEMKEVTLSYTLSGNCPDVTVIVTSNEPTGNESDWEVVDNHHLLLRAERNGSGDGRIYTITVTGTNASGNPINESVNVIVPKSFGHSSSLEQDATTLLPDNPFTIRIASNPATSYFTLDIKSMQQAPVEIKVYDISGKVIERWKGKGDIRNFRFGHAYRPGLYIVEATQNMQRKTLKVVKMP